MRVLNFYSTNYHGHLLCRKKNVTIRLGDKSEKYCAGDIVWITTGQRYSPRKKIFTAVLDKVEVKSVVDVTDEDLRCESPDMKSTEDLLKFLKEIYKRDFSENEVVTVIYFSEIME